MFTRNYWTYVAANSVSQASSLYGDYNSYRSLISVSGAPATDKPYGSNTYNHYILMPTPDYMSYVRTVDVSTNFADTTNGTMFSGRGVFFGTGNVSPTIDDYKLSGDVIQNITYSSMDNSTFAEDGSNYVLSRTYTITNNNETDITIGEVGYFGESYYRGPNSNNYTHIFYLLERTALESPITIPAGGVGQVTYTIQMNYPVA